MPSIWTASFWLRSSWESSSSRMGTQQTSSRKRTLTKGVRYCMITLWCLLLFLDFFGLFFGPGMQRFRCWCHFEDLFYLSTALPFLGQYWHHRAAASETHHLAFFQPRWDVISMLRASSDLTNDLAEVIQRDLKIAKNQLTIRSHVFSSGDFEWDLSRDEICSRCTAPGIWKTCDLRTCLKSWCRRNLTRWAAGGHSDADLGVINDRPVLLLQAIRCLDPPWVGPIRHRPWAIQLDAESPHESGPFHGFAVWECPARCGWTLEVLQTWRCEDDSRPGDLFGWSYCCWW